MNNYFQLNMCASTAWIIQNLLERAFVRVGTINGGILRVVAKTASSNRTLIAETVFKLHTPIAPLERWQIVGAASYAKAEAVTERMKTILNDVMCEWQVYLFQPAGETRGEFREELLSTPVNGFTHGEFIPMDEFSLDLACAALGFDTPEAFEAWLEAGQHACPHERLMELISKNLGPDAHINTWGKLNIRFA